MTCVLFINNLLIVIAYCSVSLWKCCLATSLFVQQQLPTMNNLQTELKVFFEDEQTGQYSSAYYLPIVPTMTAAEICTCVCVCSHY